MNAIRVTLPFPPSGNHAVKHTRDGRHYKTHEARAFERMVALKCARMRPFPDLVAVELHFYRGEREGRAGARLVRGDLDDLEKVLLDSLQGYAYENDARVRWKWSTLEEDRSYPRVEVTVCPLEQKRAPPG